MSQTERLYWVDAQIRAGRYPNAQALADQFGVSLRTAYDDRNYLTDRLHAPVATDRRRGGWYYTDATYAIPFLALSEPEAAALRRSLLAAQEYLGPAEADAVRLLYERLKPYMPPGEEAETVAGSIHLAPEASFPPDLVDACLRAIRNRQRMRLRYYSAHNDATSTRVVRPYHLHNFQGEQHLIAWCEMREDFRQFFLGRIEAYELLEPDAAFLRDPAFDADTYFSRGLGLRHSEPLIRVRVRFSPYQARWVRERRYHGSQVSELQPDGSMLVTLEVAGTQEVKRWLLSFGAEVEVLEPEGLREEMVEEARRIVRLYMSERAP